MPPRRGGRPLHPIYDPPHVVALLILGLMLAIFILPFPERLRTGELPQPSLVARRWIVAVVTLVALSLHLWSYWSLQPQVPAGAAPGTVLYRGPGDGLFYLFFILLPWVAMQAVNLGLACYCSRSWRQATAAGGLLLATWIAVGWAGHRLLDCPEGMVCAAG